MRRPYGYPRLNTGPYTKDLRLYALLGDGANQDLVTGLFGQVDGIADPIGAIGARGRQLNLSPSTSDSTLDFAHDQRHNATEFTLMIAVTDTAESVVFPSLLTKQNGSNTARSWWFGGDTGTGYGFGFTSSGSSRFTTMSSTGGIVGGEHIYAVTFDQPDVTVYRDGVQVASGSLNFTPDANDTGPVKIGATDGEAGLSFDTVDTYMMAMWGRALSAKEIMDLNVDPFLPVRQDEFNIGFVPPAAAGRVMSSLAGSGGLVYHGGLAGKGGGLAG